MAKKKTDLRALIEKQRASLDKPITEKIAVALGGELVPVTIMRLRPDEWQSLVATHPPRDGVKADMNTGYDQSTFARDYPRMIIDGETLSVDEWHDIWDVLNSVNRNAIGAVVWNVNVFAAIQEINALGKAAAGRPSSSPAPSGSRPAASTGGNRPKSRRTTTTTTPDA